MAGNDQAGNDKPPSPNPSSLSLDEAERVASQFTPMWDDPTLDAAPAAPAAPAAQEPAPPPVAAPAPVLPREPAPPPPAAPARSVPSPALEPVIPIAAPLQPAPIAVVAAPIVAAPPPAVAAAPDPALPDSKIEYAPPRALPLAQKTMLGLAPVSVDVAAVGSQPPATSTPVGVPSAPPARAALQMVGERAPSPEHQAEAEDPTKMDTVPPRSRAAAGRKSGRGIVLGVMGVAVALILAMGVRKLMGPSESDTKVTESSARVEGVPAAAPPPPKPVAEPPPEVAAAPEPARPPPEPEPPPPEPPPPEPVKAAPEPHKAARAAPERAPRPAHVATRAATPPRVEKPRRTQPEAPTRSSPTGAKGGAIVRESPF